MKKRIGLGLLLLICVAGCRRTVVQSDLTGVKITVTYSNPSALDHIVVSGFLPTSVSAFTPGTVPATPRPLAAKQETVDLILPDNLGGTTLLLRADGMFKGGLVSSGGGAVDLLAHQLVNATVALGVAAVCGDGIIETPETCDTGSTDGKAGCSAQCQVEQGQTCSGQPSVCVLAGTCSATCTTGCCSGTTCTTPSVTACGAPGQACQACGQRADGCTPAGVCTCGGGQLCAAGQECFGGACVCDKNACAGCCVNNQCELYSTNYCQAVQGSNCSPTSCNFNVPFDVADSCGSLTPGDTNGDCLCGTSLACPSTQHCVGTCVCDATSCPNGCCDASKNCIVDNAATCGTGGVKCSSTTNCGSETCVNGSCVDCGNCHAGTGVCCTSSGVCSINQFPNCGLGGPTACNRCDASKTSTCNASGKCVCGSTGGPCPDSQTCVGSGTSATCGCDDSSCSAKGEGGCCTSSTGTCNSAPSWPNCPTGDSANVCTACDSTTSESPCCDFTKGSCPNGGCVCGNTGGPCAAGEVCTQQPQGPSLCVCNGCLINGGSSTGVAGGGGQCLTLDQETAQQCGTSGSICKSCPDTYTCFNGNCISGVKSSGGLSGGSSAGSTLELPPANR